MRSNVDADIAWYQAQIASCNGALASVALEPASLSRDAEQRVLIEALGRYQATLEHLLRLRAMIDTPSPAAGREAR